MLLTRKQLAEKMQVHPQTIYRWSKVSKIPVIKLGKSYRYVLSDVIKALEAAG